MSVNAVDIQRPTGVVCPALERRRARVGDELQRARAQLGQARAAVAHAEVLLLAARVEREQAAYKVAELIELLESLQSDIEAD